MKSKSKLRLRAARRRRSAKARRDLGMFVTGHTWVWPTLETLHFVGLCMLFTTVLIVNLRLLGMIKVVPDAAVYQLLPLGMIGFGINLISGHAVLRRRPRAVQRERRLLLEDRSSSCSAA